MQLWWAPEGQVCVLLLDLPKQDLIPLACPNSFPPEVIPLLPKAVSTLLLESERFRRTPSKAYC